MPLAAALPVIAGFTAGMIQGLTLFAIYSICAAGKALGYLKWRYCELRETAEVGKKETESSVHQ
jgi:hypothetical protein